MIFTLVASQIPPYDVLRRRARVQLKMGLNAPVRGALRGPPPVYVTGSSRGATESPPYSVQPILSTPSPTFNYDEHWKCPSTCNL
jgi:hypothetical protein